MTPDEIKDIFERARQADIEEVAGHGSCGVKLYRAGNRLRGECPLCGASKGKKSGGAFSADPKHGVFRCWACDVGGDVIRLAQEMRRETPIEAAAWLANAEIPRRAVGPASPARIPAPAPAGGGGMADRLWRESRSSGQLVETYLRSRRIDGEILAGALRRLRFHPRALWQWNADPDERIYAPAMLAQVVSPAEDGRPVPTGGIHATYLLPDGSGKAALDPAKRMWGPQAGADGRPGGVWLTAVHGHGPLIVGEGLESTLAAGVLFGAPCRMAAALALQRLQGGHLTDKWGRIDPEAIQSDPERPAFTWPEPKARPWGEVMIAIDRDMGPVRIKVRAFSGGTVKRELDAEARARICAGLAVQAWRRAGAKKVKPIAPAAGRDFSDELRVA